MGAKVERGLLFLQPHLDMVNIYLTNLHTTCFLETLNAQWGAIFLDDTQLTRDSYRQIVAQLSSYIPLLDYYYHEFSSWGYGIFDQGKQVTKVEEDFELLYTFGDELARSRNDEWIS